MKRLQMESPGSVLLSATGILFALLLSIASCKKTEIATAAPQGNVDRISAILLGEIFSSSIEEAQDDDGLAFFCNDGKNLLAAEKISPAVLMTTGPLANATIIYSQYGLFVRDNDTQRIWFYILNTPESREKFEMVRSMLSGEIQSTEISGTISMRLSESWI